MASDESSAAALTAEAPDLANGSSECSASKAVAEEVVDGVDDLALDEPQEAAKKKKKKNKSK